MVNQEGDLGQMGGLSAEILQVLRQHLNQARIIGDVRGSAVSKEGKPQTIHSQMPFNAIRGFVKAETLRLDACMQVFFTACESIMIKVGHCGFFPT